MKGWARLPQMTRVNGWYGSLCTQSFVQDTLTVDIDPVVNRVENRVSPRCDLAIQEGQSIIAITGFFLAFYTSTREQQYSRRAERGSVLPLLEVFQNTLQWDSISECCKHSVQHSVCLNIYNSTSPPRVGSAIGLRTLDVTVLLPLGKLQLWPD